MEESRGLIAEARGKTQGNKGEGEVRGRSTSARDEAAIWGNARESTGQRKPGMDDGDLRRWMMASKQAIEIATDG